MYSHILEIIEGTQLEIIVNFFPPLMFHQVYACNNMHETKRVFGLCESEKKEENS
jgi:hypothetical protein